MTEAFAALLLAHVIADFVLQTRFIAENKRRASVLLLHAAIVLLTAQAALGRVDLWELPALAALHALTDWLKARLARPGLAAFLADQAVHLALLAALAAWRPGLWAGGLWAGLGVQWLPGLMAFAAGAILATRAGGFAVGMLMAPWAGDDLPKGLTNGGKLIGLLERGLIFVLVLIGQPQGVGLLMAAKSILRYGALKEDRALSEYVIIGTLASFGWALVVAYATLAGLALQPPLGIPPATP